MSINKKSLRYILYTFPVFLLCIFPLLMGCIVYSINLNSKQLDTNKGLIEYVNDYLPFNASYSNVVVSNPPSYKSLHDYLYDLEPTRFSTSQTFILPTPISYGDGSITRTGWAPLPVWRIQLSINGSNHYEYFDLIYVLYYDYIANLDINGAYSYLDSLGIKNDYPDTNSFRPLNIFRTQLNTYLSSIDTSGSFDIIYNNTPTTSILSDVYMNLFNNLVLPTSSNLGLPYYLFNYMFYVLGIFILYILFIFLVFVPKSLIALLDKSIDKLSGGNNV